MSADGPKKLTKAQQVFIDEYLKCWNATDAYCVAYPKASRNSARAASARLLAGVSISAAIKERIEQNAMSADEVLARLARHARGSMADFIRVSENGDAFLDMSAAEDAGMLDIVRKFGHVRKTFGEDGEEESRSIELYSAKDALQLLGKNLGLFDDRLNVKLEDELNKALDLLEQNLDPDTYGEVLAILSRHSSQ